MMLAKSCRGAAVWQFMVTSPTLAEAAQAGAGVAAPAADLPWSLLALLALGGCLAALAGYLWFGDTSQRRRDRTHRDRLDRLNQPAAISGTDGTLTWANRNARGDDAKLPNTLLELFARRARIDAGLVYRTAAAALEYGFAGERVACRNGDGMCVLIARFDPPKSLIWTMLPARDLPISAPAEGAGRYDDAPFGYLSVDAAGNATGNACFQGMFAAAPALATLTQAAPSDTAWQHVLLKGRDGREQICQVFADPQLAGDPDRRAYFVFPVVEPGAGFGGSTAALDAVPVALIQLDLQGRVQWCNRLARKMVGADLEPGTDIAEAAISLGRPIGALLADAASDSRGRREMLRLRSDGDIFLQITVTLVTLNGAPALLAVLTDASELRQLEDKFVQSQKMEAVGKLAGGVAHDFNNVLTAIRGYSDLLLLGKDALHPDYSDLIQIRQNTHRAAALVRQLLAFSRKQTLNPALISVEDVVADTQYLLNRLIGERVSLALDYGRELGQVRADRQQIEQALMNLVVNARDAMPSGGVVTIATANRRIAANTRHDGVEIPAGDYVEVTVSDQGTGIPARIIDRVFEPFFTTKPQGEGTGLGLSTVYGIVKQSGGYVFAENLPAGGACFRILLPRAEPGAVTTPAPRERPAAERGDLTGKGTVLLVEDEDPVRAFSSRALRLRGYEVIEAESAEQAMEVIDNPATRIDLLVSDVVMPGTDGPTLAAEARLKRPGLRVIFISGYAEDLFRRKIVGDDFLFLAKPYSLVELTAKVKEAMGQTDAAEVR